MIKFPPVKVGAHTVTFERHPLHEEDLVGLYFQDLKKIRMDDKAVRCRTAELQIYFHELLHSLEDIYLDGIGTLTERQIDNLAEGLVQVLLDNKKFRELFNDKKENS